MKHVVLWECPAGLLIFTELFGCNKAGKRSKGVIEWPKSHSLELEWTYNIATYIPTSKEICLFMI